MWNFNDSKDFVLIHHFSVPSIFTYGEKKDPSKREEIRKIALKNFPEKSPNCKWYAFYIKVERNPLKRPLDIENVPKLIVDAFSSKQIEKDESHYSKTGLYADDDLKHVRAVQIEGRFSDNRSDNTEVWIFGKT
jgi:hypothetical protein